MENKTVLIVDDDDDFRDNIIDILEGLGYTVCAANRCSEALNIARTSSPQVTLLDIKLPDGSGTDLLKKLKEIDPECVFIMMTAFADLKTALEALEHGALQYLQKPVQPQELLHALARVFDTIRLRQEKTQAEEKLRESEETIRSLIDAYPDFAALFDLAGNVIAANKRVLDSLARDPREVKSLPFSESFASEEQKEKRRQAMGQVVQQKESVLLEETIKGCFYETLVSPVFDKAGNVHRFAVFSRDVTEIRQIDEEKRKLESILSHTQRMEAIGTLTGGIAHDFNNLLQGILGYTQILLLDTTLGETHLHKLHEISRAAQTAGNLTRQLLTFSRKIESHPRALDLNETIMQVSGLLKHTIPKMIVIDTALEEPLWPVYADQNQMEQILLNLAVNARDAMPEGGRFTVETQNVVLDEAFCRVIPGFSPGNYVMLRLTDTGSGMNKEIMDHIFEPFFTTKEVGKGSGLGLAMVFGIIQANKGHIVCESAQGKGTSFTIYVPALQDMGSIDEISSKKEAIVGGSECILVVDDEEALRNVASITLNHFGYRTILAKDGESAAQLYKQHKEEISLVILDLIMPGMGGRRCLDELLLIDPKAKILIASGFIQDETARILMKAGARGLIPKPYKVDQLLKTIRNSLDNPGQNTL